MEEYKGRPFDFGDPITLGSRILEILHSGLASHALLIENNVVMKEMMRLLNEMPFLMKGDRSGKQRAAIYLIGLLSHLVDDQATPRQILAVYHLTLFVEWAAQSSSRNDDVTAAVRFMMERLLTRDMLYLGYVDGMRNSISTTSIGKVRIIYPPQAELDVLALCFNFPEPILVLPVARTGGEDSNQYESIWVMVRDPDLVNVYTLLHELAKYTQDAHDSDPASEGYFWSYNKDKGYLLGEVLGEDCWLTPDEVAIVINMHITASGPSRRNG